MDKQGYIQMILKEVEKLDHNDFFTSITIAQAILESNWGKSELATNANNHFGHKYSDYTGDHYIKDAQETVDGELVTDKDVWWRKYKTLADGVKDHAGWLTRSLYYADYYKEAIEAKDYVEQAHALMGTYATDTPTAFSIGYAQKLINIIKDYDLAKHDTKKESDTMAYPQPQMIDRRKRALGYPGSGVYPRRALSAIEQIVRHYTAVDRTGPESNTIKAHENYWRSHHGWDIGGYGIYIDFLGTIYRNYDFDVVTYGAGKLNPRLFHICLEGSSPSKHTPAQLRALDDVMLWLVTGPLKHLSGNDIRGHWEIPYNSTACPGMTKNSLDAYRLKISKLADKDWGDTSTPVEGIEVSKSGKYTVKHGDTLWAIGQAHDVSVKDLQQWNNIAPGQWLKTDQVLYVVEPKLNAYTVVKGDYLWKIAQEFGVTVDELKEWNELETNFIYVGQELFVKDPELEDMEETPVSDEMPVPEEQAPEQPEDKGDETPAVELKENQYLRWDGVIIETKVVE